MPTILELFKGSPMDKAVKADKDTVIEQELTGIRPHSAVELNNPLLYGNEAIRIATRSTSSVEKMKQATGGSAGSGGLIGKALGKITGGKFGKFVFGGKVTSLNQARDGVNTRLGIPTNAIPTYVYNTGGLQAGIEPDTMITISKIKNDANGTLIGQFLKKTGGGTPQTIGKNLIGGGISLGKSKLRDALFGKQNSMGTNVANASDSFSGADSGGKSAKLAWEYSSTLPYSKQINTAKFNTKNIDGYVEGASSNILKKVTQLQDDAKKKLGESALNAQNTLLKGARKGTATQQVVDDGIKDREKTTPAWNNKYSTINSQYRVRNSQETKLRVPTQQEIDSIIAEYYQSEKDKETYNYTPKEVYYSSDSTYDSQLRKAEIDDENDGDGKFSRIDLSLVSPIYGVDRKKTNGIYGKTGYAFFDKKNNTGRYSPYNPTEKYAEKNKANWENTYGITNKSDNLTISNVEANPSETLEKLDLIPFWIKSKRDGQTAHFRAYITGLSETSTPAWNTNKFFGNPYNFYTYDGVERSVQFTLKVIALNSKELGANWAKLEFLTNQTYPKFTSIARGTYAQPPIVSFRIGNLYKDKTAYIENLSYTIDDNTPWETNIEGMLLPKFIDVAITFKFIEQMGSEGLAIYNFEKTDSAIKMVNQQNSAGGAFTTDRVENTNQEPANTKLDKTGVPVKPKKEGGVNKTQKDTKGNTQPTPKDEQTGGLDYSSKSISEWVKKTEEQTKKLINKGVPENAASVIGKEENVDINSVVKLNETTWYYERPYLGGKGTYQGTFNVKESLSYNYRGWVADYNGGVDTLKKL